MISPEEVHAICREHAGGLDWSPDWLNAMGWWVNLTVGRCTVPVNIYGHTAETFTALVRCMREQEEGAMRERMTPKTETTPHTYNYAGDTVTVDGKTWRRVGPTPQPEPKRCDREPAWLDAARNAADRAASSVEALAHDLVYQDDGPADTVPTLREIARITTAAADELEPLVGEDLAWRAARDGGE